MILERNLVSHLARLQQIFKRFDRTVEQINRSPFFSFWPGFKLFVFDDGILAEIC